MFKRKSSVHIIQPHEIHSLFWLNHQGAAQPHVFCIRAGTKGESLNVLLTLIIRNNQEARRRHTFHFSSPLKASVCIKRTASNSILNPDFPRRRDGFETPFNRETLWSKLPDAFARSKQTEASSVRKINDEEVASCCRKSPNFTQTNKQKNLSYIFKLQPVHFFSYTLHTINETLGNVKWLDEKERDGTKRHVMASFMTNDSVWVLRTKSAGLRNQRAAFLSS